MTNVVKSAVYTFLQAWVATFLLALSGFLVDVLEWAGELGDGGAAVAFPDPSVLLKLVATGVVSLLIAVVTALHTFVRDKGFLGEPPGYPAPTSQT
jgi:hypothetical protein